MQNKALWKKLLKVSLASAVAIAPLAGASIAQADQHDQDNHSQHDGGSHQFQQHDRGQSQYHGQSQYQSHDGNQGHDQNQSQNHTFVPQNHNFVPQSHTFVQPQNQTHNWNQNNDRPDFNRSHDQSHTWQRHDNNSHDDNWHLHNGYVRDGSHWLWHGHDDAWWIDNGYWWNGSIWLGLDFGDFGIGIGDYPYSNYSPNYYPGNNDDYQDFTGTVIAVHNDHEFDIRVDGDVFSVFTTDEIPERLYDGDVVHVYGERTGDNDISHSDVTIVHHDDE